MVGWRKRILTIPKHIFEVPQLVNTSPWSVSPETTLSLIKSVSNSNVLHDEFARNLTQSSFTKSYHHHFYHNTSSIHQR